MKTIQVSDEDYEFLVEAQKLLKSQNNRCTADPLYCVMEKERVYGIDSDYSSDFEWYNPNGDCGESSEDIFNELIEEEDGLSELVEIYNDENEYLDPHNEKAIQILKDWFLEEVEEDCIGYSELQDYLEDKEYRKVYYLDHHCISQHSNIFSFFEQDAIEYVKSKNGGIDLAVDKVDNYKKDKYNKMYSYAESSWRSSRMNRIRKIIQELNLNG